MGPAGEWINEVIDKVDMVLEHTTLGVGDEHWEHVVEQEQRLAHLDLDMERIHREHQDHHERTPWHATWFNKAADLKMQAPTLQTGDRSADQQVDAGASSSHMPPPGVRDVVLAA